MAYRCLNHPERDAIGVCVKCRKYVCAECATKIAGVNYCADCLPRAGGGEKRRARSWEKPAAALITLCSLLVCSLVIGVFAVFFIPKASSDVPAEQWERNDEWLETVVRALVEYEEDCGRFPGDEEGLGALLSSCGSRGWKGPYLGAPELGSWGELVDIYGTPLRYRSGGLKSPVIASAGADRVFQTDVSELEGGEDGEGDDAVFWVR